MAFLLGLKGHLGCHHTSLSVMDFRIFGIISFIACLCFSPLHLCHYDGCMVSALRSHGGISFCLIWRWKCWQWNQVEAAIPALSLATLHTSPSYSGNTFYLLFSLFPDTGDSRFFGIQVAFHCGKGIDYSPDFLGELRAAQIVIQRLHLFTFVEVHKFIFVGLYQIMRSVSATGRTTAVLTTQMSSIMQKGSGCLLRQARCYQNGQFCIGLSLIVLKLRYPCV